MMQFIKHIQFQRFRCSAFKTHYQIQFTRNTQTGTRVKPNFLHRFIEFVRKRNVTDNLEDGSYKHLMTACLCAAISLPTIFTGCLIWKARRDNLYRGIEELQVHETPYVQNMSMSPSRKAVVAIIMANVAGSTLHLNPEITPQINRYFIYKASKAHSVFSSILSTISPKSLSSFVLPMVSFLVFSTQIADTFSPQELVAVYLSAGVFSVVSAASYHALISKKLVSRGGPAGAMFAILAIYCTRNEQSTFSIAESVTMLNVLQAVTACELIGLYCLSKGLSSFSHCSHLAGLFFGIVYAKFLHEYVWLQYGQILSSKYEHLVSEKKSV